MTHAQHGSDQPTVSGLQKRVVSPFLRGMQSFASQAQDVMQQQMEHFAQMQEEFRQKHMANHPGAMVPTDGALRVQVLC